MSKTINISYLCDDGQLWYSKEFCDFQLKEKDKEIERLNNIIPELDKYLEEIKDTVIMYGLYDDTYKATNLYSDIKNKLKELKGEDKE